MPCLDNLKTSFISIFPRGIFFFLASKSHDYTYDGTMALVEQSLRRLQTDHLDLYQHHFLGRMGQLEQLRQRDRAVLEQLLDLGTAATCLGGLLESPSALLRGQLRSGVSSAFASQRLFL